MEVFVRFQRNIILTHQINGTKKIRVDTVEGRSK